MISGAHASRPRPRSLWSGALFIALLAPAIADPARAQDPVPADPLPQDTVAGDTLPQDTAATDSLIPPPQLPSIDPVGPATVARGVWEWDRPMLLRLPYLSLLELLERLPGVVPVRSDIVNHAEGAVVFGATAGAVRWVIDGYALDPLVGATLDPSRLPLLALESVRVERRVTGATVRIETLSPETPQPKTIIEAATGDFDVQLFRGLFLSPRVLGGPLALGFERLASDGASAGSSNHTAGWLKWSWVRDSSGLQVEYRQGEMNRAGIGDGLSGTRRDWLVRARTARGPVTGEVYAGASHVDDDRGTVVLREGTPQLGIRLGGRWEAPVPVEGRAAFRLRDHPRLPVTDVELAARARPLGWMAVGAEGRWGWWQEGPATGTLTLRAEAGPFLGVTAFSEATTAAPASRGGSSLRIPFPGAADLRLERSGIRAGAELGVGGFALSGAWIRARQDPLVGIGLPAEGPLPRLPGGEASGYEIITRVPTGWAPLSLHGWYVGMDAPADWLYLPDHHWRASLLYHHLPLPSGNVEFFARVEHQFRGRMSVPAGPPLEDPPTGEPPVEEPLAEVAAYRATNLELTIRVLTVRAFLRWENIANRRGQQDLPQLFHPGQHILYGVKWEFLN